MIRENTCCFLSDRVILPQEKPSVLDQLTLALGHLAGEHQLQYFALSGESDFEELAIHGLCLLRKAFPHLKLLLFTNQNALFHPWFFQMDLCIRCEDPQAYLRAKCGHCLCRSGPNPGHEGMTPHYLTNFVTK